MGFDKENGLKLSGILTKKKEFDAKIQLLMPVIQEF